MSLLCAIGYFSLFDIFTFLYKTVYSFDCVFRRETREGDEAGKYEVISNGKRSTAVASTALIPRLQFSILYFQQFSPHF